MPGKCPELSGQTLNFMQGKPWVTAYPAQGVAHRLRGRSTERVFRRASRGPDIRNRRACRSRFGLSRWSRSRFALELMYYRADGGFTCVDGEGSAPEPIVARMVREDHHALHHCRFRPRRCPCGWRSLPCAGNGRSIGFAQTGAGRSPPAPPERRGTGATKRRPGAIGPGAIGPGGQSAAAGPGR
jgi:hypothetical protein